MSSIVCPSCQAYLGLAAAGAADCPKCAAVLPAARRDAPRDGPAAAHDAGGRDVVVGGLWLLGGVAVTTFTYLNAAEYGGKYVVAWGAMLFGGLQFLRGLMAGGRK